MEYNYTDDTLLHSVGFNLQRFVSVLNNGIVSKNKAKELGLSFSKNYLISGQDDDYISMLRVGNIRLDEEVSAYKLHTNFGISFIVENVECLTDKDKYFIHRVDEVLVKDFISVDNIKGIAIPSMFQKQKLEDLTIIPPDITSYLNIKDIVDNYVKFLGTYNYVVDRDSLLDFLNEVKSINNFLYKMKVKKDEATLTEDDKIDLEEVMNDYPEVLRELNEFLGFATYECFSRILGDNINLCDIINYLTNEKLEIYNIPYDTKTMGGEGRK